MTTEEPAVGEDSTVQLDLRPSDLVKDELPDQPNSEQSTFLTATDEEQELIVREALKDVVDPELMVNVVDLGLVYGVHVDDEAQVTVDMTLTSAACPMTDRIEWESKAVLGHLASDVIINWVWLPAWNLEMITEDGRAQLQALGFMI